MRIPSATEFPSVNSGIEGNVPFFVPQYGDTAEPDSQVSLGDRRRASPVACQRQPMPKAVVKSAVVENAVVESAVVEGAVVEGAVVVVEVEAGSDAENVGFRADERP